MEHFKKLNSAEETGEASNDNLTEVVKKFSPKSNSQLNHEFDEQELSFLMAKLKDNKAGGIDWIRNEFLKKLPQASLLSCVNSLIWS